MSRLDRFGAYRFIGVRDDMTVYDCDQPDELATLTERASAEQLLQRNLLQSFAPDTLEEARNRGFRAARGRAGNGVAEGRSRP